MYHLFYSYIRSGIIFLALLQTSCATAQYETAQDPSQLAIQTKTSAINSIVDTPTTHKLLFLDQFEYTVGRDNDPNGSHTFKKSGGWSHIKAVNITGSHAGYLYTVNRIPGFTGSFPGKNSKSVLAIEARPGSFQSQSDFYLQYGQEHGPTDTIPGNVWFQFWIYPNHYDDPENKEDQLSAFGHRFKFIYPCNGPYPCQQGRLKWLNTMGYMTSEPYWKSGPNTELYITTVDPFNTDIKYFRAPEWNQFKLGQTDVSERIAPNRWTLVKIHYDTSTASGRFEAWLKPLGGQWKKVAEWIDGYTRQFEWKINPSNVGGHRVMRIPTTLDHFDSWIYIDDFAMSTSEKALPQY